MRDWDWKWKVEPSYWDFVEIVERMNCGIIAEDAEGLIRYANARVLEWSGYSLEELEDRPVSLLFPPELHEDLRDERKRALEGDQRKRLVSLQRKDGRTAPVVVAPTRLGEDAEPYLLSMLVDLGEVHTARPIGSADRSLAADLASVAQKLQSMSFSASIAREREFSAEHPIFAGLSRREREVLEQLVSGSRVPSIAETFSISPNTVRNHLKAIYRKLGVSSQNELIELARDPSRRRGGE